LVSENGYCFGLGRTLQNSPVKAHVLQERRQELRRVGWRYRAEVLVIYLNSYTFRCVKRADKQAGLADLPCIQNIGES
jgi:hypothetical protein